MSVAEKVVNVSNLTGKGSWIGDGGVSRHTCGRGRRRILIRSMQEKTKEVRVTATFKFSFRASALKLKVEQYIKINKSQMCYNN